MSTCRIADTRLGTNAASCERLTGDQLEQVSDVAVGFDRMSKRRVGQYFVAVLAADPFTPDESTLLQVLDHSLDGSLGNSNASGHFTEHQFRLGVQNN